MASCPQQKYALLGYSQGATVTDISLHNFTDPASAAYQAIKAIVVIGNPGHVYGASANVDQNGTYTTRYFTGSYYGSGGGAIPNIYYNDSKVLDICYTGDLVCAFNSTFAIEPEHLLYGSTLNVQKIGADFMIHKLGSGGNGTATTSGGGSNTTTSSTPAVYNGAADSNLQLNREIVVSVFIGLVVAMLRS